MKSPLIFRVFKNDQIQVVKQFVDKDQVLFGHNAEVDVDLDSSEVSSIHCLIEKRGNQFYLCDLGSTQGTFKNGQGVLDEAIQSGDEFTVGPFKIAFFVGAPKPVHSPKTGSEIVIEPTAPRAAVQAAVAATVIAAAMPTSSKASVETAKPFIQSPLVASKSNTLRGNVFSKKGGKNKKTFAPPSENRDLRDFIKPGKGQLVEVIVSWKERILNTYHFVPTGIKKLGSRHEIQVPEGSSPKDWSFLDLTNGVTVRTTAEMVVEIQKDGDIKKSGDQNYKLQQNEAVFVTLINGMQLIVRYAPIAPAVPFESPLILTSSELTGILAALIIAALASLIVSVTVPKQAVKEEEIQRVAQVIFNKPPVDIKPPTPPAPVQNPKEQVEKKPTPPPEPKKITDSDKQKENKTKGDPNKPEQKSQAAQSAGRANEVKPKDSKLKAKMFTSTKQGGAVKTGDKSAANAQSKEPDPTNSGLLAAFGSGGARSKLDKAYSGSGELLGAGEKATGASGYNENRAGDDLGSKFKDTGAGGKGTATQGIAGIGTKGRGTGMSAYGSGTGFGSKDQVAIQAGGAEEEFSGSIDREAVRRVVRSALSAFKSCYDREFKKDTKLEGKVVISWEIHEKGVAKNAQVVHSKSTIGNSAVEECVRSRMLSLRFPEPPAGSFAEVTYPFLFQGQK
ncbi:MAG: AgmX/PglI C-terminal domain-containing protein [Bdellovibrio sp.]|nr:AgmX/PglI C-terminal domain-containing protein [Bdellovibrio sp.]